MMMLAAGLCTVLACGQDNSAVRPVDTPSAMKSVEPPVEPATPPTVAPAEAKPTVAADTKPMVASPPAKLRLQIANAWRPCQLTVRPCTKQGKPCSAHEQCTVMLARFIPEGTPLELLLRGPRTERWRYAADERVFEGPFYAYQHTGTTSGFRSTKDGSNQVPVRFDDQGRITTVGHRRLEYLRDGRTAGYSTRTNGGKWKPTVTYKWGAEQMYKVSWIYPDFHEFCEPSPASVELDGQGRVVREVYADCQFESYSEFTLRYGYDAAGRPDIVDVECQPGGDAATWQLALKYECSETEKSWRRRADDPVRAHRGRDR